jgi:hypothetical protein
LTYRVAESIGFESHPVSVRSGCFYASPLFGCHLFFAPQKTEPTSKV